MYFTTYKPQTRAYIWNTAQAVDIEANVQLSDFTELHTEIEPEQLRQTLERVRRENKDATLHDPLLMTLTTGDCASCRVWIDRSELKARPELVDLQQDSDFYSDQ